MAYRSSGRRRAASSRGYGGRVGRSLSRRSYRAARPRTTRRVSSARRGGSSRGGVTRIELVINPASAMGVNAAPLGMKPVAGPQKARF